MPTASATARRASPLPPSERRTAIIRAALPLLIDRGLTVTTRQIAEVAGVSEGTLFNVFADKDEFIDSIVAANATEIVGDEGGAQSMIVRDPLGVVVVLAPWNFPADEILLLAVPALAAGNTVIVKPSEVAPLTGQQVVAALQSVLPGGVVQCLQGDGALGAALVSSPINMVAMTGSSAVGRKIMRECADDLKRCVGQGGVKVQMHGHEDGYEDLRACWGTVTHASHPHPRVRQAGPRAGRQGSDGGLRRRRPRQGRGGRRHLLALQLRAGLLLG